MKEEDLEKLAEIGKSLTRFENLTDDRTAAHAYLVMASEAILKAYWAAKFDMAQDGE